MRFICYNCGRLDNHHSTGKLTYDIQQLLMGAQNVLETPLLDGPVEERLKVLALTDKSDE